MVKYRDLYMPNLTHNNLTISTHQRTVAATSSHIIEVNLDANPPDLPEVIETELEESPACIDPNFLLTILDPREIFVPMSLKRAIWLMTVFAAIGGIVYYRDDVKSTLKGWAEANNMAIMMLLYLYEPLLYVFELIATPKYPVELPVLVEPTPTHSPLQTGSLNQTPPIIIESNHDLAVVIPCHNSAEFIANTINSALRHVRPNQIFLMDNGKSNLPTDLTKKVAHDIHPEINYFWLPKVASKNWAQLFAIKYINEHRQELTLVLIIDDDTLIPPNFSIRREFLLDPGIKAIAYPIRAISPFKKQPLLVKWQDREYIKADLHKLNLDNFGSLDCPHGAAALVRRDALWKILTERHNGLWYGEDLRIGYELDGEWRLDLNCYFNTLVPQTLLGKPLNLYHQRVRAWDQALLLFPWSLILKPLFTMKRGSLLATLLLKNSQIYTLYSTLMQIFRFPLMLMVVNNPRFWMVFAASNVSEVILGLSFNYLKLPPYLRGEPLPIILLPIYKGLIATMGTLSFLRVLFVTGSIPRNTRSLGFQLGHSEVVMYESSLVPISADDNTILQHLLPLPSIRLMNSNLTQPHQEISRDTETNYVETATAIENDNYHIDNTLPISRSEMSIRNITTRRDENTNFSILIARSRFFLDRSTTRAISRTSSRERSNSSSSSVDRASTICVVEGESEDRHKIARSISAFN